MSEVRPSFLYIVQVNLSRVSVNKTFVMIHVYIRAKYLSCVSVNDIRAEYLNL